MEELDFPENVTMAISDRLSLSSEFSIVLRRPLRPTDNNRSCGVFSAGWSPQEWEIGQYDPAITRHDYQIQTLAKYATEEEGLVAHTKLAKIVRLMLYRDADLRLQLSQLRTTVEGVVERTQKWDVVSQRYLANEIEGQFLFLAVTDFYLETEIV